jgi:hypothetical protein
VRLVLCSLVAASRLPARGGILAPVRSLPRVVVHAEHSAHMRITLCRCRTAKSVARTRITCASQPTGGSYRRTPECGSLHHHKASLASHPSNTLADSSGTAIPIPQMTRRSRAPRPSGTRTRVSVRVVQGAGISFFAGLWTDSSPSSGTDVANRCKLRSRSNEWARATPSAYAPMTNAYRMISANPTPGGLYLRLAWQSLNGKEITSHFCLRSSQNVYLQNTLTDF